MRTGRRRLLTCLGRLATVVGLGVLLAGGGVMAVGTEGGGAVAAAVPAPGSAPGGSAPEAITQGLRVYQQTCAACHGPAGDGIPTADISHPERMGQLSDAELFNLIARGAEGTAMPGFAFLGEDAVRYLVAYLRYLAAERADAAAGPASTGGDGTAGGKPTVITLDAVDRAVAGETLQLRAGVMDDEGRPVIGVQVRFALRTSFFVTDLLEIGEAVTDQDGVALLEYVPRATGKVDVIARYEGSNRYQPGETSLSLEVRQGLQSYSPAMGGRWPPVIPWIVAAVVAGVWGCYIYSLYQLYRIAGE